MKSEHQINIQSQIERLLKSELLSETEIKETCRLSIEIFSKEKTVLNVSSPITICGDIHGQFSDLLELFEISGRVPYVSYLFLGDYVDRGYKSVETISLLLSYKILFPNRIFLTRGNHESRKITQVYGFYDECFKKYRSYSVWKCFTDVFDYIPLCALVDGRVCRFIYIYIYIYLYTYIPISIYLYLYICIYMHLSHI